MKNEVDMEKWLERVENSCCEVYEIEGVGSNEPHWIWPGAVTNGYPVSTDPRTKRKALMRPLIHEVRFGKRTEGRIVMLCGLRLCINPWHMRVVKHGRKAQEKGRG